MRHLFRLLVVRVTTHPYTPGGIHHEALSFLLVASRGRAIMLTGTPSAVAQAAGCRGR
jgi:hypothetical protein